MKNRTVNKSGFIRIQDELTSVKQLKASEYAITKTSTKFWIKLALELIVNFMYTLRIHATYILRRAPSLPSKRYTTDTLL